ncbi:MAG: hypothetical protein WCC08_17590 [Terrimicrobiaceae bacterium]
MDSSLPTDKKPFFFGAADKLATALKRAQQEPTILTLRMRTALAMDATGSERAGGFARAGIGGRARRKRHGTLRDRTYTLEELKGALHANI